MTPAKLADLIAAAGSSGGPGKSLEEWLRQDFFGQHCSMFHQRPFIWQIWDGRKDGFSVLVNYHQLAAPSGEGRRLLEKITYTYLGDWINQQKKAAAAGVAGADVRILAATELAAKLASIIAGEPPYDIFVRWKPLHQQPIGWEPDINDGVRLNIRPFIEAGVLRGKVNVNWKKDRGAEPQSLRPRKMFPWFWGWDEKAADFKGGAEFTGERFNALHYTNAVKLAARKQAKEEAWDAELEAAKTVKSKRK